MRTCTFLDRRGQERCTECGVTSDLCLCTEVDEKAHDRTQTNPGRFLREIFLLRSTAPAHNLVEEMAEQFGTLAMMLVRNRDGGTPPESDIRQHMIRLGILLTALASYGTPEYTYPSE